MIAHISDMNDFTSLEKNIVRELSCRLCLCSDVSKLKPLNAELKRKIKKIFEITVRTDDNLPKAICHDCLQQVGSAHLYAIKVEKTQRFLDFYNVKSNIDKQNHNQTHANKLHPITSLIAGTENTSSHNNSTKHSLISNSTSPSSEQGDTKRSRVREKKKTPSHMKFLESMPLEEFVDSECLDKSDLKTNPEKKPIDHSAKDHNFSTADKQIKDDALDPIVIIDGKPAKHGAELDNQISLFYKMECCICHELGLNFKSLMKHYKEKHGVPGYVTCCNKKFHYFYPKKVIEHMAYHLQPNIFMCSSCHQNFQTSQQLSDHQNNGGKSQGRITCPRCSERYPTYLELGWHISTHRSEKSQCDYCGKLLKHHHRKKTINHMEDIILCSHCVRVLKSIEKQEKEIKEKVKSKSNDRSMKYQKFRQAMGLSADEDASTE